MPSKKGEVLATDRNGDVCAKQEGYILMPLYQGQGDEVFFVVEDCPPPSQELTAPSK